MNYNRERTARSKKKSKKREDGSSWTTHRRLVIDKNLRKIYEKTKKAILPKIKQNVEEIW